MSVFEYVISASKLTSYSSDIDIVVKISKRNTLCIQLVSLTLDLVYANSGYYAPGYTTVDDIKHQMISTISSISDVLSTLADEY